MNCLDKLNKLMKQRKMTHYRLAKASNVPLSTINSMFKNNNSPTIPTLEGLCNGLGITLYEFFYDPKLNKTHDKETEELLEIWSLLSTKQRMVMKDILNLLLAE